MKNYFFPVNRSYLETLAQPLACEFVIRVNYVSCCPLKREFFMVHADYLEQALQFLNSLTLVKSVDVKNVYDVDFF